MFSFSSTFTISTLSRFPVTTYRSPRQPEAHTRLSTGSALHNEGTEPTGARSLGSQPSFPYGLLQWYTARHRRAPHDSPSCIGRRAFLALISAGVARAQDPVTRPIVSEDACP